MKAYLKQNFKKGYLLTEETIIKISDIILKRFKETGIKEELNYKVYRKDSLVYETTDYKKFLEEENSKRNLINKLDIYHNCDNLKFKLTFDKEEGVNLEIEASEKDSAYLLFSDLKEYLSTEILKFRGFKFEKLKLERYIMPVFMFLFMIFTFSFISRPKLTESQINHILSTDSTNVKINYLVQNSLSTFKLKNLWYLFIAIVVVAILATSTTELLDTVYPRNIFYIGKEIARYDKHCSIRSKIIWGIIIALIVSIIAGFVVLFFTNR
jgi:hypothetical protein